MGKIFTEYDLDYEKFYTPSEPGESFEKQAGRPILFDPGKGRPGILLIHS